ncbi:hypothetical protein MHYP_G00012630 [Metynnis hypsauchen]
MVSPLPGKYELSSPRGAEPPLTARHTETVTSPPPPQTRTTPWTERITNTQLLTLRRLPRVCVMLLQEKRSKYELSSPRGAEPPLTARHTETVTSPPPPQTRTTPWTERITNTQLLTLRRLPRVCVMLLQEKRSTALPMMHCALHI